MGTEDASKMTDLSKTPEKKEYKVKVDTKPKPSYMNDTRGFKRYT